MVDFSVFEIYIILGVKYWYISLPLGLLLAGVTIFAKERGTTVRVLSLVGSLFFLIPFITYGIFSINTELQQRNNRQEREAHSWVLKEPATIAGVDVPAGTKIYFNIWFDVNESRKASLTDIQTFLFFEPTEIFGITAKGRKMLIFIQNFNLTREDKMSQFDSVFKLHRAKYLWGLICILLATACTPSKRTVEQQGAVQQDTLKTEQQHIVIETPPDTVTYTAGSHFIQGFARVKTDSATFYINTAGLRAFDQILYPRDNGFHRFATIERGPRDTTSLPDDFVYVRKGDKYGSLTITGEWLLKPQYDAIDTQFSSFWEVTKDGKQSHYLPSGELLPFRFDSVNYLDGIYFDVKKGGSWGVYNRKTDEMVIPFAYQAFDYCGGCETKGNYVFAKKDGKWGIVNFQNEVLIPFEYEHQHHMMRSDEWVKSLYKNGERMIINLKTGVIKPARQTRNKNDTEKMAQSFVRKRKNGKWGMLNPAGELVLDYKYDFIKYVADTTGFYLPAPYVGINKDRKKGIADTSGTIIIPPKYDGWFSITEDKRLFISANNGDPVVFNRNGEQVLQAGYDNITELYLPKTDKRGAVSLIKIKQDSLLGFYNPVTDEMIEPQYTRIENYSVFVSDHLLRVMKNGKKGVINIHGEVVLPVKYDKLYGYNLDHLGLVITVKDSIRGVFDLEQHQMIIPVKYDHISTPYEDSDVFRLTNGEKFGLANVDGEVMTPIAFNRIIKVDKGNFLLIKKDAAGAYVYKILTKHSGEIDSLPFQYVELSGKKGVLIVTENGSQKLYNTATKKVIQGEYAENGFPDNIERFYNQRAQIKKNGKFGFINSDGDVIVPPTYDNATAFYEGAAIVMKKQPASRGYFYGYIDSTGSVIVPVEYAYKPNSITRDYYENGYLVLYQFPDAQMNYLKGYATKAGEILIKPRYTDIYPNHSGDHFLVKRDRKYGVLDATSAMVIPAVCDEVILNEQPRFMGPGYVANFSFPLLCRQGKRWVHLNKKGETLPVVVEDTISFYKNERWY